eukprot:1177743-Prorocentrum_minimum.AAC.1
MEEGAPAADVDTDQWKLQRAGLYFGASKIAAISGYNPYSDMPVLFHESVYQGRQGALLLRKDCELLGIERVDAEVELIKVMDKAGPEAKKAVEAGRLPTLSRRNIRNR